ncbi:hypothetical protein ACIBHY_06650 [Nonomuraea sp. NPDC050547]|uniref:hypothetical protein n=1 Tax=Nonomuraea sp. NPDC050547 TaxID=3364368 RepID=UPI0037A823C1
MAGLKLSVALMYHPSRETAAKALAAQRAELSPRLVAGPPGHGIALPVSSGGPRNSYLFRRAAPLSRHERTPTRGFLLPAGHARAPTRRLAEVPDEVRACVASWPADGLSREDEARLDVYGRAELADMRGRPPPGRGARRTLPRNCRGRSGVRIRWGCRGRGRR